MSVVVVGSLGCIGSRISVRAWSRGRCTAMIAVAHTGAALGAHAYVRTWRVAAASVPHAATIGHVHPWLVKVVVAMAIMIEHRIIPCGVVPAHRTEEIVECAVPIVLPVEQYAS